METLFLSIDGVPIEDVEENGYTAYEQELGTFERMISGRMVKEIRSKVWVVEVSYEDISTETMLSLQTAMRLRKEHQLTFLPSDGRTELITSLFHLTVLPSPTLRSWLPNTTPAWSSFTLHFEEINGHD